MACEKNITFWFVLVSIMVFLPCILQGIGLFTPYWVSDANCSSIGLYFRCCGNESEECQNDNDETYINKTALVLEAASFGLLILLPVLIGLVILWIRLEINRHHNCKIIPLVILYVLILVYAFTGLLISYGCGLVRIEYPDSVGYSYIFSIAAGLITCLEPFMVCLFIREKIDCLREMKVPSMTSGCQLITSKGINTRGEDKWV